jgi:hypothetical protein
MGGAMRSLGQSLKGLLKTLGIIAIVIKAFQAPLAMIGQMMSILVMFFKPLSDVIVWFLKPVLLQLMKGLIAWLQLWNMFKESNFGETLKKMVELLGIASINPQVVNDWIMGFNDKAKEVIAEAILWLGEKLNTFFFETLPGWIVSAFNWAKELFLAIGGWINENILQPLMELWTAFVDWFGETVVEPVKELWAEVVEWFVENIIDPIKELWQTIVDWFTEHIIDPVMAAWQTIADTFTINIIDPIKVAWAALVDYVDGLIQKIIGWFDTVRSTWSTIKSALGGGDEENVGDALITSDGKVIKFDPNDDIMASKNGFQGMGGGTNVTVNISALDASSISSTLVNDLTMKISEQLKRELSGRSSYGIGI